MIKKIEQFDLYIAFTPYQMSLSHFLSRDKLF